VGLTTTLVAVGPVLQVKRLVPDAVSVADLLKQIEVGVLTVKRGSGFTVTETVAGVPDIQPTLLVPDTV
jgi:hypothetical protein